ncbi:prolyl oligopeptidase family serine peptidase [Naasia sp. SYSU D00948]|uniref:dipeptidyl-peptidase 5 n=1 Tax=Naasia sp. SYSU D00948 TaxID=2817379 RepID=UPI001B316F0E|nr:prolyl oligopeptidase family serine peptidase [Naasia sp. SYSU D00948]
MTAPTVAPFGTWTSPITARDVAAGSHPVSGARYVGDEVWWLELRGSEGGRYGVFRSGADGEPEAVLPAPWNARSRVHEYGGGAWTPAPGGALAFVEFSDQRIHLLRPGAADPQPLTPSGTGDRYADLGIHGDHLVAVRERHDGGRVSRDIVLVPLDGSGAGDGDAVVSVVAGSDFLAYPRFSPDGTRLAWIAWDHPRMPWDGTELRVGEVRDGRVSDWRSLVGGPEESVLQPEWDGEDDLLVITDRTGWWNLHRASLDGRLTPVLAQERETGGPLWNLGKPWYLRPDDDDLALVTTHGSDRLELVPAGGGAARVLDLPLTTIDLLDARPGRLLLDGGSAALLSGIRELDLATGALTDIRLDYDDLPAADLLPLAEERTFPGPREVHAVVYPPRNPAFEAPDGELPPYVAFVHGGPTTRTTASVNLVFAYYTSRGIGVIDVNYGGSTGYGRAYRERLRGQWGVVDVEDVVTAVTGLAGAGLADPRRLAIEGGSAGGWTVLSALTRTDVFACGVSLYGVADLTALAEDTHDFESRYTDGLVGPLPEAQALYDERSPLSHIDGLDCPVLLLQGLDDPVVPPAQSERFRDGLIAKGIPHAYLAFEGESHGFRKVETRVRVREAALSFYGQVFGFEPAGVPVLDLWRPQAE